jgi:hypothetical protein
MTDVNIVIIVGSTRLGRHARPRSPGAVAQRRRRHADSASLKAEPGALKPLRG